MRYFPSAAILCLLFLIPSSAHAALIFSEIAWMGSADSPNDEWIELYNSGDSAVSLEGWFIRDGGGLEIPLSGTIGGGEYAVLERTDDTTVGGTAFLIYTGSLANTGATLSLYRTDASLEDQVSGGENWENIGGDNITKETAQHTQSGWRTAPATPGRGLGATEVENEEDKKTTTDAEETTDSDEKSIVVELQLPEVALALQLLVPDIVYVDQNVVFDAEASGLGETQLDSLAYTWNYGDLSTDSGKRTTHAYAYPGEYVVTLYASFARHEQVVRKTIKVLPVAFSVSRNSKGDVLILNNAKYEVNISGFQLEGKEKVVFPPRSIILANGTITIPKEKLGGNFFTPITLFNQKGLVLASSFQAQPVAQTPRALAFEGTSAKEKVILKAAQQSAKDEVSLATSSNFSFMGEVTNAKKATETAAVRDFQDDLALLPAANATERIPKEALPLLGLAGIVTLGIMAIFFGRRQGTE